MSKHYKSVGLAFALFILFIASCQKNTLENTGDTLSAQQIAALKSLGYDPEKAEPRGEGLIYDGDLYLPNEILETLSTQETSPQDHEGTEDRMYNTYGGIVKQDKIASISFYIDAGVPASWRDQVLQAMALWENEPNSKINFTNQVPAANANVKIYMDNSNEIPLAMRNLQNEIAVAIPALGGNIGSIISLNDAYNWISAGAKKHVALHELGHTMGLGHVEGNGWGDQWIVGTGIGWDQSVMWSQVDVNNPMTYVGADDAHAMSMFYPMAFKTPVWYSYANVGGAYPLKITMERPKYTNGTRIRPYYMCVERWNTAGTELKERFRSCPVWGSGFPCGFQNLPGGGETYTFTMPCPQGNWKIKVRWESFTRGSGCGIYNPSGGPGEAVSAFTEKNITL